MTKLTVADVRAKFPQYEDLSDEQLLEGVRRKFYNDIPRETFFSKFGMQAAPSPSADRAPPAAPRAPRVDTTAPQAPAAPAPTPEAEIAGLMAPEAAPSLPPVPQMTVPDAAAPALIDTATGRTRLSEVPPPSRPASLTLEAMPKPDTRFTPRATLAPADDPLIAAMTAPQPAPAATSSRDLTGSRAPSDPFEGEGLGALAARRGQQFVQGATDVVAAVPEAVAITGERADRSRAAGAGEAMDQRAQIIADITATLEDPNLDPEDRALLERNLADLTEGQGVIQGIKDAPIVPAQDRPIYGAGEKIRTAVEEVVGAPDPRDRGFWGQVATGAGNMTGMIGAAAAGTMVGGPVAGAAIGAGTGSAMNQSQVFEEALQSGADQETALQAARWASLIGASEIIPITRALKLLPPRLRGELTTGMMRKFVDIAQASGEEAAQEYLATVANNIVAQQLYDPDRGWTEGATEAALVGAVLGAGVGTAGVALEGRGNAAPPATVPPRPPAQPQTPEEELAAVMGAPMPQPAPAAPPTPAQPVQPQAEAAPVAPEAPPEAEIAAAMGADPAPAPQQADPTEGGRYEILDEIENTPGGPVATGRKIRIDLETGQATVVGADGTPAQAGGAPGPNGGAGTQPQAEDAPVGAGDVPPAAGSAPDEELAAAMGAEARPVAPQVDIPSLPPELMWTRKRVGQQTPRSVVDQRNRWWKSLPIEQRTAMIDASGNRGMSPDVDLTKIDPDAADAIIATAPYADTPAAAPESEIAAAMAPEAPAPADGFDVGARAARFPTTLEDIATPPQKGEMGRQTHIYGELDGKRYYLGSVTGNADSAAQEWAKTYPQARILTTDRADGTSINGEVPELDAALAAKAGAPAAPEQEIAAAMGAEIDPEDAAANQEGMSSRPEDVLPVLQKGGEYWRFFPGAHGRAVKTYPVESGTRIEIQLYDFKTGKAVPGRQTFDIWTRDGKLYRNQGWGDRVEWLEIKPVTKAVATAPAGSSPAQAPAGIDFQSIRTDTARTPAGTEIDVEFAIVDLGDLTASNLPDGRVNPAYPQERQPRDRTKDASERQIQRIMRDFDPRQLDAAPTTDTGAMIVDENGIVESGNGRTITLQRIYQERPDLARAYVAHLEAQGYPVEGIARPVLVRIRRTEMTPEEIEAYTRESNTDTKLAMSATEQAMSDAAALPDSALDLYRGGDIDTAGNRDFVRAFIQAVVTENEQGKMIAPDGSMSQDAVRRVQGALLAKAYGDPALVAKLIESADNNIKSIGGALLDVSASWAKMRGAARAGTIAPEMDQTEALIEAVRLVDRARTERRNVIEFVKQPDLLSGEGISPMGQRFLALMFRDTRQWTKPAGRDNLAKWLGYYVEEAMKSAPGADLFGAQANPGGTLDLAKEKQDGDEKGSGGSQADLFAPRPAGSDGQGVRPADGGGAGPDPQGATPQDGGQRPAGQPEGLKPPTVTSNSAATFAQWKRSLPSPGTVRGWRIFDDREIGNGWVLMTDEKRAGPFPDEAAARAWAQENPAATTEQTPDATSPKPTPILDELQRAIDARAALLRPGEATEPDGHVDYMLNSSTSLWKRLSQAKTEEDRRTAAVDWVTEEAAGQNVEFMVAFDTSGAVIAALRGGKDAINFPAYLSRAIEAGAVGYTVHNHPSNRGPSLMDLKTMAGGAPNMEIVGTLQKGQFSDLPGRHMLNRGSVLTEAVGKDGIEAMHKAATERLATMGNAMMQRRKAELLANPLPATDTSTSVERGNDDLDALRDRLNFTFDHIITLALARMGILDYEGNADALVRAAGVNPDDFFDDLFTAVQPVAGRLRLQLTRGGDRGGDRAAGSADSAAGTAGGTGGTDRGTAGDAGTGDRTGRHDRDSADLEARAKAASDWLKANGFEKSADVAQADAQGRYGFLLDAWEARIEVLKAARAAGGYPEPNQNFVYSKDDAKPGDVLTLPAKRGNMAEIFMLEVAPGQWLQATSYEISDAGGSGPLMVSSDGTLPSRDAALAKAVAKLRLTMDKAVSNRGNSATQVANAKKILAWLDTLAPRPSTPSDSPPKTRAPKSGKPSSGNADLDAALDDIFGDDDAPGTGDDLERDSGDADTQDDMGGTDVPPAAGGSGPGAGKRGGKGGGTGGKRGGRRSIPGGDAAPVGGAGDQGVDAGGGTKRRPAAGGNGGRGAGAGAGGLSPDAGGGANPAGTSAGGTRVALTDAERAAAIRDILKENLEHMIDRPGFAEGDGLDPRKYEALEALFIDGMRAAGADPAKMSDRDMFRAIATPLKNAGLDRETIVKMAPYLEAFTRNVKSGRVNLDPEPDPQPAPEDKAEAQRKADRIKPVMAEEANIRATLPTLLPEQQDDVVKIERRFAKPDGHGMLITNGTGTGKTFTGGGVIKRFVQMGKGEILIIAPSEAVIAGWKRALEALGVPVNQLRDTRDAGQGVTITTYANLEQNQALATRSFDLVVTDESQNLMQNKDGLPTGALNSLRALTHRPQDIWRKSRMLHADEWAKVKAMRDGEAKTQEYARLRKIEEREVEAWSKEPRSKVLFLSATPFAYDKTVDYVEGYLFNYPEDGNVGRSRQDGRALFMIQNFGYRIRYHKLTKPESAVDSAVFEREFHEKLKREGVLSGRSLQVDVDYDRKFVTVADAVGTKIDAVLKTLWDGRRSNDKALADGYETIQRGVMKKFNYLRRMQLLEAIKARAAVDDIKAHLALGRKVVVFHDYNVGGGFNPFGGISVLDDANALAALADLMQKHPDLNEIDFSSYGAPADTLKAAFGKQAAVFSGLVPQRQRLDGLAKFNTDDSGTDILIVQSDAGGAGISMHDLTGTHQRVLINLGMPTKPTTTLQEEGRILRVGTLTDAIFRYYTIGTAWEREAFAQRIAERSGTVENLALGNEARALRDAFIDAYVEAEPRTPSAEDGKGGKAKDGAAVKASPYEIAKTHYFGKMKVRGRRDQREGNDWYATPEPLGFKMVEWAGVRPNERVLEPSAGDGAIARYFPENVAITMVEPSNDLGTRALLRAPTATLATTTFEDYHIVNKHHVIVMNPPFGSGGATAMAHLAKAARHLRDGGRLIALIPTGPSADKRFDAWWESDDAKEFNWTADIALPAVAFERAGTNVMTRIVILDRISDKNERAYFGARDGGTKRLNFTGAKDITEFFDRLEMYDVPRRPEPKRDVIEELEAETQTAEAAPPSVKPGPALTTGLGGFKLGKTKHAKTGDDLFVATIANRVERDTYTALNALARSHGGWYSNFRGNGAIPGFQFKSEAARAAFLEDAAKPTVNADTEPDGLAESGEPVIQKKQMHIEAQNATQEILRLMPRLRAELDRLDLKRVKLYFDPLEPDWQGMFQVTGDGDFEVVIGASLDPMKTLHHEVIHILRTMNLFTPEEWRALEIAAGKGWMEKHDIVARYPHLTHEERLEEAIAEEFSWALEKMRPPKGNLLVQAFNKIHRVLKAIRNVFRGAGFNTPEDIFGRILSGEISKRQAWNTGYYARMGYNLQAADRRVVASLSGDEIAAGADIRDMGRNAEVWYRNNLVGTTVTNAETGMEVRFNNVGAKKIGGRKGADLYRIVPALREIIEKGAVVSSEPDRLNRAEFKAIHKIEASVKLDGDVKTVIATVREKNDGTFHYDLSMERGAGGFSSPTVRDQARTSALEGDPADVNLEEKPVDRKMQARPLVARPLTPQGRAHRNTAMGGPLFIPDRRVWDELTRAGLPIWQRLRNGRGAVSDAVDRARQVIQDRFLPVLRAQEAIMRATGRPIPAEQNAYIAETTFSGKVGRHLLDIDEAYTKPIIQLIAETDGDLTMEAVGEWLYARHAIERNAYIASINPDMPDGGSGMTDQDAQDILDDAKNGPHASRLQKIGALIDQLRERNLKLREDAGLITSAEADMWRKQYKHYVPLKGFAETDHVEAVLDVTGVGKRYSIRGQESKRALGRSSEAFNPLQAAITQAQEVSIRAEKNRVGQALYELAKSFPSKALWEVKTPAQKRYFNRSTGMVETRVEDPVSLIMDPNEMAVKVAGKEVRILLKDERLARAVNTIGADQMSGIMRVMSMFSRFFSMTRTMLNPEFMITNAFRDFQTAQFNIQAFGEADKNRIAKAMAKNWRKAFLGVMRGQGYQFDTEWSRYFDEFQKAGAQVWFWTMEQPEAAKGDLEQRIRLARGGRARRVMTFMTTPSAIFNMRDNPALAFVEKTNLAVDNAIRLAAFVEARKAGWSIEQAAFLAKELTVNFNRRGEVGAQMNALYPFFNAAIQGSVRTVKALGSKRVAKMVAVAFAAGALNDLVNAALSEEDEDEELVYDKIPDYRNERNIHIGWFANSRNPVAIPMPYGYNVFPYAGQQLGKVIRGVKNPDEAMADVLAAAFGAFSPVNAATPAQAISPVISDPIVEMAENKNWLGAPIYPQTYGNQTEPDAYVHFRGATEVSKLVAQGLNSLTGGDFRQSGAIDVSPESLDHLATFVTGSAGAFWGRSADFLAKVAQGNFEEIEGRNVPFVRNVFSPVGEWVDRDRFYQFRAEVRDANADAKAYAEAGLPVPEDVAKLAGLYDKLLETERELNGKGEWNPARANARTPREAVRVYLDFNREYLRVAGKQGQ